ncbi:MAG: hypothetical protein H6581_04205 [Bacteroidia bacterium]|nr:hypothetical protein [Bacteroidia bacterium]
MRKSFLRLFFLSLLLAAGAFVNAQTVGFFVKPGMHWGWRFLHADLWDIEGIGPWERYYQYNFSGFGVEAGFFINQWAIKPGLSYQYQQVSRIYESAIPYPTGQFGDIHSVVFSLRQPVFTGGKFMGQEVNPEFGIIAPVFKFAINKISTYPGADGSYGFELHFYPVQTRGNLVSFFGGVTYYFPFNLDTGGEYIASKAVYANRMTQVNLGLAWWYLPVERD